MRIEGRTFRTKVGRRLAGLFLLCALVPLGAVTVLFFSSTRNALDAERRDRLYQTGKLVSMGITERVRHLAVELDRVRLDYLPRSSRTLDNFVGHDPVVPAGFTNLGVAYGVGEAGRLNGSIEELSDLSPRQVEHLTSGQTLLLSATGSGASPVTLWRALDASDLSEGILWAEVDANHLWGLLGGQEVMLPDFQVCVLDESWRKLLCEEPSPATVSQRIPERRVSEVTATFEWEDADQQYMAAYNVVFLQHDFAADNWTVLLSEPQAARWSSTRDLSLMLALLLGSTIAGIVLLASTQIRRVLNPLLEFEKGAERITGGDFSQPVAVRSGDEFEDLAESFNMMSGKVEKQLATFAAITEIDHAVLGSPDRESIVQTVLAGARQILPCDAIGISLRDGPQYETHELRVTGGNLGERAYQVRLEPEEIVELLRNGDHLMIDDGPGSRTYLSVEPYAEYGATSFLVAPIILSRELLGMIVLGFGETTPNMEDVVSDVSRIRAQFTVALSNIQLITRLDQLGRGAVRALARAIDAKSQWTAGHSERVTDMAVRIGERLELSVHELELLHLGGLLHDIGKIGLPAAVLDKPARLTDEEYEKAKEHPRMGAKILAPITAYADVIPLVLYHHERYDGAGYPNGLIGEQIPLLARVITVADVFDAVTTPRPYREAMSTGEAVELIRRDSGGHFDPTIVEAFLAVMVEQAPAELDRSVGPAVLSA
ncbi:MAG: HD domain-containing protein [Gemmatimonadota bacterium]|nr:HD domain-containing protein [Gemmatimonadota bacterium]